MIGSVCLFLNHPVIVSACECNEVGRKHESCNEKGECSCKTNFGGDKCEACANEQSGFPNCIQCAPEFYGAPDCHGKSSLYYHYEI